MGGGAGGGGGGGREGCAGGGGGGGEGGQPGGPGLDPRCPPRGPHADPRRILLQVGDDVAVGEHRALGYAGGTARVLQERDIAVVERRLRGRTSRSGGQSRREGVGCRDGPRRRHLFPVLCRRTGEEGRRGAAHV